MYQAAAALKTFLSGFGLPAFQEDTVPKDTGLPYITYSQAVPEWNQKASMFVRVWDRSEFNEGIIRKADQITRAIGAEGIRLPLAEGGYLAIWPESPLIQTQTDGDYRYAYINLSVNVYQLPGF